MQVTSLIPEAQQYTINFTNNNLLGSANFLDSYKTSKARVCVTVGMMTTGYDCPDILNLALMRPVFSPSDFVQIKGRGTRRHNFLEQLFDPALKTRFKLFDFFANCEYFSRPMPPTAACATSSTAGATPACTSTRPSAWPTSGPCPRRGASASPSTSRLNQFM